MVSIVEDPSHGPLAWSTGDVSTAPQQNILGIPRCAEMHTHTCMYIIYIYIYIYILCTYVYMYMHMHMYLCVCNIVIFYTEMSIPSIPKF